MKAAIVRAAGQPPVYGDFAEPIAEPGENRITVTAAALSPLARARAAGAHYSAVGRVSRRRRRRRRRTARRRAAGLFPVAASAMGRDGGIRRRAGVANCAPLPDGLDDVTAAAIANPGMSSWAAFKERAKLEGWRNRADQRCDGLGRPTGGADRQAFRREAGDRHRPQPGSFARARRARRRRDDYAWSTTRRRSRIASSALFAEGIDVVVDYLWGKSAERLLVAAAKGLQEGASLRFVQVGSASGPNIALPGAVLRSKAIALMGSGLGSVPRDRLAADIGELLQAAATSGFTIPAKAVPLSDVERAWGEGDGAGRTVFTIGAR